MDKYNDNLLALYRRMEKTFRDTSNFSLST